MDGLRRMEDLPDSDFERDRGALFERTRSQLAAIVQADPHAVDARLVSIQLAEVPLDACMGDMLQLERETRERLIATRPGFNPEAEDLWDEEARADCEANGMEFNEISDKDAWVEAMQPLYDEWIARGGVYEEFITSVQEMAAAMD